MNSWLVRNLVALVEPTERTAGTATTTGTTSRNRHGGQRFTGWARS